MSVLGRGQRAGAPGTGHVAGGDSSGTARKHAGRPGETAEPGEHVWPPEAGELPPRPRA